MRENFSFNKYNTDLDKKLRRLRGDHPMQKVVTVAIAVILIITVAIIMIIVTKNKVSEVKEDFTIEVQELNPDQVKEDIKKGINSGVEDIKEGINSGIQNLFSKEEWCNYTVRIKIFSREVILNYI